MVTAECHAHIFMDGVDYKKAAAAHENGPREDLIREHLAAYQKAGISYVRDGGDPYGAGVLARSLAPEYGITYRTPVFAIHRAGRYGKIVGRAFSDGKEYCALVREVRRAGGDFIKIMTTGILDFATKGHVTSEPLSREEVFAMTAAAHDAGLSVMAHVNGAQAVMDAAEAGVDSVEHGNFQNEESICCMAEHATIWVPTIVTVSNLLENGRYPAETLAWIFETQKKGLQLAFEKDVVLAADILHHRLVELVASDLDGSGLDHAAQGDDGDVGGAAADVHHHVAVGLGDVDARADGRRYRLLNKIHLPGAGLNTGIDDGALLNLRDTGGHADDDPGLEEGKARDLMNKLLEHPLRHIVVGDNALPQRPDGNDVAGGTAQHSLRVRAHLQQLAGGLIHSHHRGLVEHNALALYIYQYGGGTQVDTDIFCDPHRDTSCSFRKCCTESIISGISVRNHTFSIITVHIPDCKTGIMNFFPFSPAASGRR